MKLIRMTVLFFVLSVAALGTLNIANAEETKIAYVNLRKVFDGYEKTKESEKALEKSLNKKEKERNKLVDEIRKLKDEIALLSEKGRQEKQPIVEEKLKELQEFDREARNDIKEARDEMARDIEREMSKVIGAYGKKHGYTVILNDLVAVYWDESIDITQEIVDGLNKNYKKR